jgi:diguanylate cyclase (GGDEF)-like protein
MRLASGADDVKEASGESMESIRQIGRGDKDSPARILVVDDEMVACRALESMLIDAGYQVQSCVSGQEAIIKLSNSSFDVVITDLSMSSIDGAEVLTRARESDPFCEVIVVTGHAPLESVAEVMKLGAYDCISKTFDIDRIRPVLDEAIDRRRRVRIDGLPELYDNRAFYTLLEAEFGRSQRHLRPLSLLLLSVDDGQMDVGIREHPAGDAILKDVARLIQKSVRNCDVVARYKRDRFAIILVETNKVDAIDTANRLRRLVEEAAVEWCDVLAHENRSVSASIGVASYPIDACRQMQLVAKAEQAMYEAMESGGNGVRTAAQQLALMGTYHERRSYFVWKRCMDIIGSLALLTVTSPLLLLIGVLIKLDSPGPVLFRQPRVGLRKRRIDGQTVWELSAFTMHKFRTMCHERGRGMHWQFMKALIQEDEEEVARIWNSSDRAVKKLTEDPRITRVGRALRKATLDELPQLWNVLKGEMSLVGPRPPIPYETAEYEARHWRRVEAIPGCTGLWQVSGWNKLGYKEQVELDIWYIKHQSLWLDMKILLQTIPTVLRRIGGG